MNQTEKFILINRGTGIAGHYLASLRKNVSKNFNGEGSRASMFASFVKAHEPSHSFDSSLTAISASFYLDKLNKIDFQKELTNNHKNYIITMFANWYCDKRRKNQRDYDRNVAFTLEEHDVIIVKQTDQTNYLMEKEMKLSRIDDYFKNFATAEERYIQLVELGIHTPVRSETRHYVDYPAGSISHTTYINKKKKLSEKLTNFINKENQND